MKKLHKLIALMLVLVMSAGAMTLSVSAKAEKPEFDIRDGILYAYNGDGGDVVVPDGVIEVWGSVFEDDTRITSVTFPEGCKRVDTGFRCCTNLTTIICPYSVEYIHIDMPSHLTALRKVVIPNEWADVSKSYKQCGTLMIDENGNVTQVEPPRRPENTYRITLSVPSFDGAPSPLIHGSTKVVSNGERYGEILEIEDMSNFYLQRWQHPVWKLPSGEIVTSDSIVNLTADTTITLCPDPAYDKPVVNLDNSMSSWAKADIETANAAKLIPDELKTNFKSAITREEFCMLMVKLIEARTGMEAGDFATLNGSKVACSFKDVSSFTYIYPAYSLGIVNGTSATTFNPKGTITRQEAAAMLERTAKVLNISSNGTGMSFSDNAADWAKNSVAFVSGCTDPVSGSPIMGGVGNGRFDPYGTYTREQAIVTTLRLFHCA